MAQDNEVIAITSLTRSNTNKYVVFFNKKGLMKKAYLEEYTKEKGSTWIAAIKLNEGDSIANVEFINEENIFVIVPFILKIKILILFEELPQE